MPQPRSSRTRSDAFRSMLSDQAAAAAAPSTADSSSPASRQNSVAISVVGQKTIADGAAPSDAAAEANATSASPVTPAVQDASTPAATQPALERLSVALRAANIDPTALNLKSYEQRVFCPGGDYTNKGIEVKCGQNTEYLSADLVALYPEIAVADIKRSLALSEPA